MRRALTFLSIASLAAMVSCADRANDSQTAEKRYDEKRHEAGAAADPANANAYRTPEPTGSAAAQVGSPTAFDQGENEQDLDITKRIRQAVVDDASLSVAAKNVTIVTNQGKVVLKGEVHSESEVTRLVAIAQQVAGPTNVNNQLEVKSLG